MSFAFAVERGDNLWKIAEKSLKQQNKEVNRNSIYCEIIRLAELNGCKNVDEFNNKFLKQSDSDENTGVKVQKNVNPNPPEMIKKPDKSDKKEDFGKVWKSIPQYESVEQEVKRINSLENDLTRIIQYNKRHYDGKHYAVIDKKSCQLTLYDKEGKVIKKFVVGVGKTKGDGLSNYFIDHLNKTDKAALAEKSRYTTPGEFTLDEVFITPKSDTKGYTGTDGQYRLMRLKGDNRGVRSGQQAIHVVYNNDANRIKAINTEDTEDNRMSYGCVNLLQEDYDELHEYLGEGDKVFILPEEKGNKLQLEKQSDGSYIFHQQNHKDDARDYSVKVASRVKYDVHPERDKTPKRTRRTRKNNPQQNVQYPWYDPRGWIPKQFDFWK